MKESILFTTAMFYDEQLYHKPTRIDLDEARACLYAYMETDHLDLPDNLTPRLFMDIWNACCDALDT